MKQILQNCADLAEGHRHPEDKGKHVNHFAAYRLYSLRGRASLFGILILAFKMLGKVHKLCL